MIGILMMFIFLWDVRKKDGFFAKRNEILMAHSCNAVIVKLSRRVPANWSMICSGNTLEIEIAKDFSVHTEDLDHLRKVMYRELANDFMHVSKTSPNDNLELTDFIIIKMNHPGLTLHALTEGKYLARLSTLTDPRIIAEHLKVTVQVQER